MRKLVVGLALVVTALVAAPARAVDAQPPPGPPLVLAHYYIWFDAQSWNHAKQDYPSIGRYSSDQASVMRTHIREAKKAGIDGFIVGWKSTPVLDRRLNQLVEITKEENFKLAITYQALDFDRNPQSTETITHDLDMFMDRWSSSPVFKIFDKPLVVWSGTWHYSHDQIAAITEPRRDRLRILASEKNAADYERVADVTDGDMYYWSSVNPASYPHYPAKLLAFGAAVRAHDGIWIAPASPGFDARKVQGTSTVGRNDGATLQREWHGAMASEPDAIGVISWNEFSENTYIEPSRHYGSRYLQVLADLTGAQGPGLDSSEPPTDSGNDGTLLRVAAIGGFVVVMFLATVWAARRPRRGGGGRQERKRKGPTPTGDNADTPPVRSSAEFVADDAAVLETIAAALHLGSSSPPQGPADGPPAR